MRSGFVFLSAGVLKSLAVAELIGAEARYREREAALETARHGVAHAYEALNQRLGFGSAVRPVLTDTVAFAPLEITTLDIEVRRALDRAPTVWLAQEQVTLQKFLEDLMFYTGEYRPYQARKIEVEQAELDARSARDALRLATRELYYTVRDLEAAHTTAAQGLAVAEETLRTTSLRHAVGLATRTAVRAAAAEVAAAEQRLFDLAAQHAHAKLAFAKPWALQAAAAEA